MDSEKKNLAKYRIEQAQTCIKSAKILVNAEDYKGAANRAYYAIFHIMRSVLALDGLDFAKHSGVSAYFRKEYIKTGVFDIEFSDIIKESFDLRSDSDYDDFFVVSKQDVEEQIENAQKFFNVVNSYIEKQCIYSSGKEETNMELWDIYDKDRKLTGRTMQRNDWNMKPGDFHLTVLGVIMNEEGKFLVTKRVMTKSWAPGQWEISGGAAQAGESSEEAVKREILEETGIDVTGFNGGYVFSYMRENPEEGDNYFVDIYRFVGNVSEADVKLQEAETAGFMFASKEEIDELGRQGVFLHYNSIKKVFEM